MRVQTEEWQLFIPGMRMYKGKMTLFWNGEVLNDWEERDKWEVIMVLPGVEVIPIGTFDGCKNVETVIMSDSVRRIEYGAVSSCSSLVYVKLSTHLEYIGKYAFEDCESLTSIFIPPSCREIDASAFRYCEKLIILSVPQDTTLGNLMIEGTALARASHFVTSKYGYYDHAVNNEVNEWIKSINNGDEYALHRACASSNPPLENDILLIMQRQGLVALRKRNSIGVTPLQYLNANPFAEKVDQRALMKQYVLEMMGEVV